MGLLPVVIISGEMKLIGGYNKPKRTPNHPKKSHVVVAKEGDKVKTIRFGEQGAKRQFRICVDGHLRLVVGADDLGIAVEVGFSSDYPDADPKQVGEVKLGKGPGGKLMY